MSKWSVIIPTLNEEKTIPFLLADLCNQTIVPTEILIVDAGSTDTTKQVVEKHIAQLKNNAETKNILVKFVSGKPPVGRQRTQGGKLAQYESICFFDADVRLESTFFEELIEFKQKHELVTACPKYIPFSGLVEDSQETIATKPNKSSLHIRAVYAAFNLLFKIGQKRYPSGAGSCIITTKTIAKKVGWFEPSYLSDDIAYIRQAAPHGFTMLPLKVYISDRRWRTYGFFPTLFTYIKMSRSFMKNDFLNPKTYTYEFGKYEKVK
jgi:glycosyltransferase involved in cell wall biosynthesis